MRKIRKSSLFTTEQQLIMRKNGITLEMARVRHKKLGYPKELAITKPVRKWVERY